MIRRVLSFEMSLQKEIARYRIILCKILFFDLLLHFVDILLIVSYVQSLYKLPLSFFLPHLSLLLAVHHHHHFTCNAELDLAQFSESS